VIRDKRLYRAQCKTFEDYCQERFGITRVHADRRISFAGLIENLKPMGFKNLPARERQARPLTALPTPELQAEAWSNAQSAAGKDQPSAKEVDALGYTSFEDYCQERFGITRRHVDRAISFVSLIEDLVPRGTKPIPATEYQARHVDRAISFVSLIENLKPIGFKNLPATERQARPLIAKITCSKSAAYST
jgi:hypothetical protein